MAECIVEGLRLTTEEVPLMMGFLGSAKEMRSAISLGDTVPADMKKESSYDVAFRRKSAKKA